MPTQLLQINMRQKMKKTSNNYLLFIVIFAGMTKSFSFSQGLQVQHHEEGRITISVQGIKPLKNSDYRKLHGSMSAIQGNYFFSFNVLFRNSLDFDSSDSDSFANALQKLEWVIKTNKTSYQPGEPIGISVSLRNSSPEDVTIYGFNSYFFTQGFFLNSMQVKNISKENKTEVNLTYEGFRIYSDVKPRDGSLMLLEEILPPGDIINVNDLYGDINTLNLYYDLSQPGEYELTFYTRDFLADDEHQIGEYPAPCTVRFKIEGNTNWLDQHVVWPEDEEEEK